MHRLHMGRRRAMGPWTSLWGWPLHTNAASADHKPLSLILASKGLHPKHAQLPARTVTLRTLIHVASALRAVALEVEWLLPHMLYLHFACEGRRRTSTCPGPGPTDPQGLRLYAALHHGAPAGSLGVVCVTSSRVDAALGRNGVATVRRVAVLERPVWQHLCSLTGDYCATVLMSTAAALHQDERKSQPQIPCDRSIAHNSAEGSDGGATSIGSAGTKGS